MKGIVFTEFLEFVEDNHGILVVDKIIEKSKLASGGIYSAVGTYKHEEIVQLVTHLSDELNIDINPLLKIYAQHFFNVLLTSYPTFFEGQTDSFEFLSLLDTYIHPEVLKLYPDAELPTFNVEHRDEKLLIMLYESQRGMYSFADGLMQGCLDHFKDNASIKLVLLEESGNKVKFIIERR